MFSQQMSTPASPIYDVAIIGSGFTGSLLAWILSKRGKKVALIDARPHPRFSIGESSTPVADLLLERISNDFLPNAVTHLKANNAARSTHPLASLSRYGTWKRDFPNLVCGKKRGFSYFRHYPFSLFDDSPSHPNSMLVTASSSDSLADTHWLRSDVDQHFFRQAIASGTDTIEATVVHTELWHDRHQVPSHENSPSLWRLSLSQNTAIEPSVFCRFIVDAGGRSSQLLQALGIADATHTLLTNTCATYGHFEQVSSWNQYVYDRNLNCSDYPFDSDDSAQHHLLENGWLWMLRFDNGITSVGWARRCTEEQSLSQPTSDLKSDLEALGIANYPSLVNLFSNAKRIFPSDRLFSSGRLQRLAGAFAGPNFALMPTAGVTIDPLHSSGIAHGLSGVYRLAKILLDSAAYSRNQITALEHYSRSVQTEARLLDLFIEGCYQAANNFALFKAHAMFYFVAAISTEETIATSEPPNTYWMADNQAFVNGVTQSYERIKHLIHSRASVAAIDEHLQWTRSVLAPWNQAGLMEPLANNMFRYTAAPK